MPAPPLNNNFDGGVNGNTIAVADTGSGDKWSTVSIGTNVTVKYSNAQAHSGGLCCEIIQPATGAVGSVAWTGLGTITTNVWARFYIYLAALPSVSTYIFRFNNQAAASCAHLKINLGGNIVAENAANLNINTGSKVIPLNQWVRIEVRVKPSTTVGEIEWWMFSTLSPGDGPDGVKPTETINAAATQVLAADIGEAKFGQPTSGFVTSQTIRLDDIKVSSHGPLGPEFPINLHPVDSRPLLPMLSNWKQLKSPVWVFPQPMVEVAAGGTTFPQAMDGTVVLVTASMQKQVGKAMTGTAVAVTGSMVRMVLKNLAGTAVAATASMQKLVLKAMTATAVVVTATLQALKVIVKAMTATTVVVTATTVKLVTKPLTGTSVVVTASRQLQVLKKLTATNVVVTATLQALKVIVKAMTATAVVVTATMSRKVFTVLNATVVVVATMTKSITHRLTATVNTTGSMVAAFIAAGSGAIIAGAVSMAASILHAVGIGDAGTASVAAQDASGADVTVMKPPGAEVTETDATGADVTIRNVDP